MTEQQLYNIYGIIEAIKIKVGILHMEIEELEMIDEQWDKYDKRFNAINLLLSDLEDELY